MSCPYDAGGILRLSIFKSTGNVISGDGGGFAPGVLVNDTLEGVGWICNSLGLWWLWGQEIISDTQLMGRVCPKNHKGGISNLNLEIDYSLKL